MKRIGCILLILTIILTGCKTGNKNKNDKENNYNDIGILFMDEPPVVVVRDYVCPVCKTKFKQAMPVYRTDEIGYKRYGHVAMGSVPV